MLKGLGITFLLCCTVMLNAQSGTVVDKKHHLEWEDSDDVPIEIWKMANSYCIHLELDDKDDWRLPTEEELLSLSKNKVFKKGLRIFEIMFFGRVTTACLKPLRSIVVTVLYLLVTTVKSMPLYVYVKVSDR